MKTKIIYLLQIKCFLVRKLMANDLLGHSGRNKTFEKAFLFSRSGCFKQKFESQLSSCYITDNKSQITRPYLSKWKGFVQLSNGSSEWNFPLARRSACTICQTVNRNKPISFPMLMLKGLLGTIRSDDGNANGNGNATKAIGLRWLDTVFQGQYLPSLSIN